MNPLPGNRIHYERDSEQACVPAPSAIRDRASAMRAAWILAYGEVPKSMRVVSPCPTPCINASHLLLVSHAELLRMISTNGWRSWITEQDVRRMRADHAAGRASFAELAERHGRSREWARYIVTRRRWKHVA